MDSQFTTVEEVARKYGVTPVTVHRFLKEGRFKARKFAQRWLIDRKSLEAYFASNSNLTTSSD
jgi:excisionase family DNA binding protein